MAKERLSKLQKWILINCYQEPDKMIIRSHIIGKRFFPIKGWVTGFFKERTPTIDAVLSNSIWSLIDKKYVIGLSPISVSNMAMIYGMQGKSIEEFNKDFGKYKLSEKVAIPSVRGKKAKVIILTDKGIAKAKELLKAK